MPAGTNTTVLVTVTYSPRIFPMLLWRNRRIGIRLSPCMYHAFQWVLKCQILYEKGTVLDNDLAPGLAPSTGTRLFFRSFSHVII